MKKLLTTIVLTTAIFGTLPITYALTNTQIDNQKDLYTALVNEMEQLELQKKQQADKQKEKTN